MCVSLDEAKNGKNKGQIIIGGENRVVKIVDMIVFFLTILGITEKRYYDITREKCPDKTTTTKKSFFVINAVSL